MNVFPFLGHYTDELEQLTTRHLIELYKYTKPTSSRIMGIVYETYYWDEEMRLEEVERINRQYKRLHLTVKEILATRPHVLRSHEARRRHVHRRPEKKALKY